MSALTSILGSIAMIGGSILGGEAISSLEESIAHKVGVSPDKMIAKANSILQKIKDADLEAYNKLAQKIAASPEAHRFSSINASKIRDAKNKLSEQSLGVEKRMRDVENLEERVRQYSYLPTSFKISSTGRDIASGIEQSMRSIKR